MKKFIKKSILTTEQKMPDTPHRDFSKTKIMPRHCRCTVVQVLREDFPLSDSEEAIKRGDEITQTSKRRRYIVFAKIAIGRI